MKRLLCLVGLIVMVVVASCAAPAKESATPAITLTGLVSNQGSWTLDQFKALTVVHETVEHPKNGSMDIDGVKFSDLFSIVKPAETAATVVFTASDGFSAEIDYATLKACDTCAVAINSDGSLSAAMPGQSSKLWVKNLITIEVK